MYRNNMHKVTIFVDGLYRDLVLDYDEIMNKDWAAYFDSMIDSNKEAKEL